MFPYRCYNKKCADLSEVKLRFNFWSDKPVCPKCGASLLDPESRHLIVRLQVIHLAQTNKWNRSTGKRVCDGKPYGRDTITSEITSVNCAACKATEVYLMAARRGGYEPIVEIPPELAQKLQTAAYTTLEKIGAKEKG